jgi:integrase
MTAVKLGTDSRHESASRQIEAGVDIALVSKRLRHSMIGLTSDTYGHLVGPVGKIAAEAAAAVIARRPAGNAGQDH